MSSELKCLASQAKRRLKNAAESSSGKYTRINHIDKSTYFYKNMAMLHRKVGDVEFVMIDDKEDENFIRKVEKVVLEDNLLNPMSKLIDQKIFSTLSATEQQMYLLKLFDRYNKVREKIVKENMQTIL